MDLSLISTADLQHLQAGNLQQVSTQALQYLQDGTPPQYYGSGQSVQAIGNNQMAPTGSPQAQAANSPVSGNTFGENALIGSGAWFTDKALAAQQIAASSAPAGLSDLITGGSDAARLAQYAADKRALDAPVNATAGGQFGQLATGALTAVPLAGVPGVATYGGAAAVGGLYGALTPTTADESRALNTGVGAGLGVVSQYGGNLLGKWLTARGSAPGLTGAQQAAADAGGQLAMRLTPGQKSGSVALQQFEAKLESQPWTSGPINALKAGNQTALNRAWAGAIGENSNTVDSEVLSQANDRLGSIFENARNPANVVNINPQTTSGVLDSIDQQARGLLPGNASVRDNPLVSDLESLTSQGQINGEQLGSLSSKLGRAASKQMMSPTGDRDWGQALYAVKNHVDDLLQSTLTGPESAEYAAARQQYRSLMQLTGRTGNLNSTTGDVSGTSIANYLQQSDKRGYLFGGNESDAYNATRFAQAFKPLVGNSGTATRSSPKLTDLALGIPANLLSRAYLSAPGGGLARAAVGSSSTLAPPAVLGRLVAPYVQAGLPGVGGSLVPYLTQ